ncbi:hypothetical protein [Paenibacillus amylolyticus]|uniref:hypothetical protein n=1 Tax=Paenibacillus amylolyticus TaxID=1451 RepID=UPI000FD8CCAB|nr:hypothetical protein [Paenibacillus amylolyticus]
MFTGFQLEYDNGMFQSYKSYGEEQYELSKSQTKVELEKYINKNNSLSGKAMQEDWFPEIEADIFLSHSHNDMNEVYSLAGWLHKEMNLKVFIDSCVWGNSKDLLKAIDDEYSRHEDSELYDYDYNKRNFSTSHVHMLLSTALTKMIDKTECVFFLKTPSSISAKEVISERTKSPWIYHELAMTELIRKKTIMEHRKHIFNENFSEVIAKSLNIEYDVSLKHLLSLDLNDLNAWLKLQKQDLEDKTSFPLDHLYKMKLQAKSK